MRWRSSSLPENTLPNVADGWESAILNHVPSNELLALHSPYRPKLPSRP